MDYNPYYVPLYGTTIDATTAIVLVAFICALVLLVFQCGIVLGWWINHVRVAAGYMGAGIDSTVEERVY